MSIACRVREMCQHQFINANQIHEYGWLQEPIARNLMGLSPHDVATIWTYRDGAFIWWRSGLHSTLRSCATGAWTDPLEKLQARPEFTAFSHKDRSTANSLESCAHPLPPKVCTSPRISSSHEQFLVHSVTNSASQRRMTWLFRYTEIA